MLEITPTRRWHERFPGAYVGALLLANVDNSRRTTPLDERKRALEACLRERYRDRTRADLLELAVLNAYRAFYKRFDKTYHVQLQLESVVHKGKSLPSVSPLVDANFAAELETLVLTAGHDADLLRPPLTLDATRGGESFRQLGGSQASLKAGDMMMSDGEGVVCTVLYGQDRRTPISPATRRALYVAYAPPGVPGAAVVRQLDLIVEHVRLFSPEAELEQREVYAADGSPPEGDARA